jgi:c-di-GMP-binding flagellar brake protein YcgR
MQPRSESRVDVRGFVLGQRMEIGYGRLPIKPGHALQIAASTSHDAMYSAVVVVEAVAREPVPLVTVRVSGAWQRTQRRDDVRVGLVVRPRVAAAIDSNDVRKKLRLAVTNISAGGVQVRTQDELRPGDRIELAFALPGVDKELQVEARVRRVYRVERDGQTVWDVGCQFEGVSASLAQRVVQFIFAQERARARSKKV